MHGVYGGRALLSSVNGFSNMPDSMLYPAVSFLKRGIIGTLWSTLEPGSTLNAPPLSDVPHVHRQTGHPVCAFNIEQHASVVSHNPFFACVPLKESGLLLLWKPQYSGSCPFWAGVRRPKYKQKSMAATGTQASRPPETHQPKGGDHGG